MAIYTKTGNIYKPMISKIIYLRESIVVIPPGIESTKSWLSIVTIYIYKLHVDYPIKPLIMSTIKTQNTIIENNPNIVEVAYRNGINLGFLLVRCKLKNTIPIKRITYTS